MADGQVLIDSKLNTSGVQKGTRELKEEFQDLAKVTEKVASKMEKELDNTGSAAEGASDSFKQLFKANLSADLVTGALKEMGEAAIELGKQAIAAAADINASNAQFEQTFKGVEKTARESLNNISKEVGITATRMQDSYTKIFAFTKSVGGDQAQALDISSRALKAAADSAAYYDVSVEQATETLQSFLKGNYENDAALGIAATETSRNTMANKLYAKSFVELSEAQKVDVLLAMVEAGNEASGALGQAAREADSWTNVTGELNEAWRLLLGALGDPLLEGLIPVVQGITSALQSLVDTSASADFASGMDEYRDSINGLEEEFEETSRSIEKNAIMAELYRDRLAELEQAGLDTAESEREYANAVAALNGIYPELNLQIDEQTGLLTENSRAQLVNLDTIKKKAVYAAQEKKLTAALEAQADAILEVRTAEKNLQAAQTERIALEQQLMEMSGKSAEEMIRLYEDQARAGWELSYAELQIYNQILALNKEEGLLAYSINASNEAIAEQDTVLEGLKGECESTASELGILTDAEKQNKAATDKAAEAQNDLAKKFQEAKDSALESLNSQIGLFQELELKSDTTAEKIVENWEKQQAAFTDYAKNLQAAVDMGLDEALVQQLADGSKESMMYLQELVTGTGTSVEEINAQFQNLSAAKEIAASAMAGVQEEIDFSIQGVGEAVTQAVSEATDGAAAVMEQSAVTIQVNFVEPVQQGMEQLGGKIEETFKGSAETMEESWKDKAKWFSSNVETPINQSVENVRKTALDTWSKIEEENAAAWERMVKNVEDAIREMQSSINSLQGKTVTVTVNQVTNSSSASAAEEAYMPAAASAVPIGIPMLATGAVIPPNAPFMAILGDQTHGRNLEAPEELLREIIRGEIGNIVVQNNISFEGELAPLIRILYPEIQSEAHRIGGSLAEEVLM